MAIKDERRSLLSSNARIQVPWIKVTIGKYTFGVFTKTGTTKDKDGFYTAYNVQYPKYITSLNIIKINGQFNQYTLALSYPVTVADDPNFFEKVLSSVSGTRKIVFTYGDAMFPTYVYKDEEAIITKVTQSFQLETATINYNIEAVSSAALTSAGSFTFVGGLKKPSDEIKRIFKNKNYNLQNIFTGMNESLLDKLIAGDDQVVEIDTKVNTAPIDYINYLVSCMIPVGQKKNNISTDIYVLTIHDDTIYDKAFYDNDFIDGVEIVGPYFRINRVNYSSEQSDAYNIDIGYNTATIVTKFSVDNNENYSLFYDYESELSDTEYINRIGNDGKWEKIYAPVITSKNNRHETKTNDITWWTKVTKYPINATITVQGLLRPAQLMTYVRLNVIFPGGHKHISSGLYLITKQLDSISGSGYTTTLSLTRISGDKDPNIN